VEPQEVLPLIEGSIYLEFHFKIFTVQCTYMTTFPFSASDLSVEMKDQATILE